MRTQSSTIARAATIARLQHGVVTREQLLDAGISSSTIKRWRDKALLHDVHPGVYRLGHRARSTEANYVAATLAGGDGVALCGFAAAYVFEALRREPPAPEITGPTDLRIRGVMTRRLARLTPEDVRTYRGIPLTSPARTMVDLAGRASLDTLAEIAHHLGVRHHLKAEDVFAAMAQRGRVNGAANLRGIYEGDAVILLSRLEKKFVRLLRSANLPLPQTNRPAGSFYVDCRWPGLTVELLGYRYHSSRHAWTRDQHRAREAYARGDDFRAYTWDDVHLTPDVVLTELSPLIPRDRAG
jgi:hypothetical protein